MSYLIRAEPWDSEVLGIRAGRVWVGAGSPAHEVLTPAGLAQFDFVSTRVPPTQCAVQGLLDLGFRWIEDYVTLEHAPAVRKGAWPSRVIPAAAGHLGQMLEIAGAAFRYDRLHADPLVPDELAVRYKAAWVKNALAGFADRCLLAVEGQKEIPVGFVLLRQKGEVLSVDLIAVDERFAGKGIGTRLLAAAETCCGELGLKRLQVGTQASNEPAIGFYQKFGFRLASIQVGLHWGRL